ncbi:glycoside hydrolase family 3 protein (plasmid) [Rhizobium leguminosarum]|uniref:glycoside hydrolase family 3 N-terminal domain-containing protein n=1 Tax=Rhizobium TaxID=379 RepID=UPI00037A18E3|nr:glycoside hydrolase family 3 N-terminal domain-containing protein [Rhizobium leguminosarum]MBA8833440.1 beta-N-acetylhexosaminidase [Rhizobium leguminosarum]MDH6274352.1 beta-N-acetylhexosaminidase [Rhizobium leguminosarum]MVO93571.1 glycoside hydrolase family 3 protein [Rhizobium leguminosarum bv. phaseoli]NKK03404.1 glycoside hydrolase family 3 protein [Rhizobium leguminosarum bv. viciae]NKK86142.1 glycoside hydrolase family 3 protein [Rhizobium leguminosarum bv. viciae]
MSSTPLALFVGLPNPTISDDEFALFRETNPLGLFVGRRNQREPEQTKRLIDRFREAVGRDDAPVFTDQEGGRVQHLDAGPWPLFRSFGQFAELARRDFDLGKKALRLSSQAMGAMMTELGLSSGCSPVLDLVFETTSAVIGARSFGPDPDFIAALGREVVDGLLETGNMPVIKHIPGHGRATLDSHKERPVVDASRETLTATDFRPFVALKDTPWAMVAHVVYSAYDAELPASVSPVMHDVIRKEMGYDGVLISDCIFMESLSGTLPERVKQVLDAGFDIALHSHGDIPESEAAAKAARPLTEAALQRIAAGKARLGNLKIDVRAAHAQVEDMFASALVS